MDKETTNLMHFSAGKESALRELLNNVQDKLSQELKINIVARIKEQLRYQSKLNPTQSQKANEDNDSLILDKFLKGECKI